MKHKNSIIIIIIIIASFSNSFAQVASFTIDKPTATYCVGETVSFTNTSTGATNWHWEFGDDKDTWALTNVAHIYQQEGTFTAKLTAYDVNGNPNVFTKQIIINPKPSISLAQTPATLVITATPSTNITYNWYINNRLLNFHEPILSFSQTATYKAEIVNEFGCSDAATKYIEIPNTNPDAIDSLQIVVKNNILTPSVQDGVNDVLFIDGLLLYNSPCEVYIYNRWGVLVYSNSNYMNEEGFKGLSSSGKELDAGTYYYIVKSKGRKGGTGYIDIIR